MAMISKLKKENILIFSLFTLIILFPISYLLGNSVINLFLFLISLTYLFYLIKNKKIKTNFDHRIAMAFTVMGSKIGNVVIEEPECISTSFPSFVSQFNKIGGNIIEV